MSNSPVTSPATPGEILVDARGIRKLYHDRPRPLEVLNNADLTVRRGEITSIVGASGAGKSTLLHLLGALDKPNAGMVHLDGKDLSKLDSKALAALRAPQRVFRSDLRDGTAAGAALVGRMSGKNDLPRLKIDLSPVAAFRDVDLSAHRTEWLSRSAASS